MLTPRAPAKNSWRVMGTQCFWVNVSVVGVGVRVGKNELKRSTNRQTEEEKEDKTHWQERKTHLLNHSRMTKAHGAY